MKVLISGIRFSMSVLLILPPRETVGVVGWSGEFDKNCGLTDGKYKAET